VNSLSSCTSVSLSRTTLFCAISLAIQVTTLHKVKTIRWARALCVLNVPTFDALWILQPWSIQVTVFTILFSLRVSLFPIQHNTNVSDISWPTELLSACRKKFARFSYSSGFKIRRGSTRRRW